uniref:Helicase ATP-binding domain-containing protein n=1 Tax=Panagrolaimus superbus TaxID=310955 RepID=A0A914YBC2_9BILA
MAGLSKGKTIAIQPTRIASEYIGKYMISKYGRAVGYINAENRDFGARQTVILYSTVGIGCVLFQEPDTFNTLILDEFHLCDLGYLKLLLKGLEAKKKIIITPATLPKTIENDLKQYGFNLLGREVIFI